MIVWKWKKRDSRTMHSDLLSDSPPCSSTALISTRLCTPSRYTRRNQILYTFINRFTSELTKMNTFYAKKRKSAIKFKKRGDRKYDDVGLKNVQLINSLRVCPSTNLIANTISECFDDDMLGWSTLSTHEFIFHLRNGEKEVTSKVGKKWKIIWIKAICSRPTHNVTKRW